MLKNKKILQDGDERINSQIYKEGFRTAIIMFVALFLDCAIKIVLNKAPKELLSSILILLIGLVYFTIRMIVDGVYAEMLSLWSSKKGTKKNILRESLSSALLFASLGILFNFKSFKVSPNIYIKSFIKDFLFWFICVYIIMIFFSKIFKKITDGGGEDDFI
ncbi:MAG: hypothetical protein F8N39_12170 [Clostridiaceae bacterium]|nr:hypothetical protein [Clostridiaceae bacterium]